MTPSKEQIEAWSEGKRGQRTYPLALECLYKSSSLMCCRINSPMSSADV